ncbi:MAG: helix-turn-helix domain-containing protein [Chloroflexales bacterium]|nr:helix-turn-helix domain-containing protein [Chloroflexales bacterium]
MTDGDDSVYLSLSAASRLLGVHSTTLRRWADAGAIPVYVTPGGHRRFSRHDIETLAARKPLSTRALGSAWAVRALAQARNDLASAPNSRHTWLARIDETDRAAWRRIGQQLMGVVLHYINNPRDDEDLLVEARRIGADYAVHARRAGMPLTAALEAALFFRDSLVESAMQLSEDVHPRPEESARLLRRISRISNEVHLSVAAGYEPVAQIQIEDRP